MEKKHTVLGAVCGIMTGVCWGSSAVISEFLFSKRGMESGWFVAVRLFFSGVMMLIFACLKNRSEVRGIVGNKKELLQAALTGIVGTMLFQLFYYGTVQRSNAGTATVLQYLCPVMVMIFVCIRNRVFPKGREVLAICFAVAGIFLVSTHGNIHRLVITSEALLWGIGCAFFMMLCTVLPESLYGKYSSQSVTAVGLFAGGIVACLVVRPWEGAIDFDVLAGLGLGLAILIGGVISYVFYGIAIKNIGPSLASLFSCSEIVTATGLSVLCFGNGFGWMDFFGILLVVGGIVIVVMRRG